MVVLRLVQPWIELMKSLQITVFCSSVVEAAGAVMGETETETERQRDRESERESERE